VIQESLLEAVERMRREQLHQKELERQAYEMKQRDDDKPVRVQRMKESRHVDASLHYHQHDVNSFESYVAQTTHFVDSISRHPTSPMKIQKQHFHASIEVVLPAHRIKKWNRYSIEYIVMALPKTNKDVDNILDHSIQIKYNSKTMILIQWLLSRCQINDVIEYFLRRLYREIMVSFCLILYRKKRIRYFITGKLPVQPIPIITLDLSRITLPILNYSFGIAMACYVQLDVDVNNVHYIHCV
jgi:hypothetical protein